MRRLMIVVALVVAFYGLEIQVCSQVQRVVPLRGRDDYRVNLSTLSRELLEQAEYLSESSYEYFMGWNGVINNNEQAVLFKTEEFASACRLFYKLLQDQSGYYRHETLSTNLYSAFRYLRAEFRQLEQRMGKVGFRDDFGRLRRDGRSFERMRKQQATRRMGLAECRRLLDRMESAFRYWRR